MSGFGLVGTERTLKTTSLVPSSNATILNNILYASGEIVFRESSTANSFIDYTIYTLDGSALGIVAAFISTGVGISCEILNPYDEAVDSCVVIRVKLKYEITDLINGILPITKTFLSVVSANEIVQVPITVNIKSEVTLIADSHLEFFATVCGEVRRLNLFLFNPSKSVPILLMDYTFEATSSVSEFVIDNVFPIVIPPSTSIELPVSYRPITLGRKEVPITFISNAKEKTVVFMGTGIALPDASIAETTKINEFITTANLGITTVKATDPTLIPVDAVTYPLRLVYPNINLGETATIKFTFTNIASIANPLLIQDILFWDKSFSLTNGMPTSTASTFMVPTHIDYVKLGSSKTYEITFKPTKTGITTSILLIKTNEGDIKCELVGYVEPMIIQPEAPEISVLPFHQQALKTAVNAPVVIGKDYFSTFPIYNHSHVPITITDVTSDYPLEFFITNITDVIGASIPPNGAIDVNVKYTPLNTVKKSPNIKHTYISQAGSSKFRSGCLEPVADFTLPIAQGVLTNKTLKYLFSDYANSGITNITASVERALGSDLTFVEVSSDSEEYPFSTPISGTATTFESSTVNFTLTLQANPIVVMPNLTRVKVTVVFIDSSTSTTYIYLVLSGSLAGASLDFNTMHNDSIETYSLAKALEFVGFVGGCKVKALFRMGNTTDLGISTTMLVGNSNGFSTTLVDNTLELVGTTLSKSVRDFSILTVFSDSSKLCTPVVIGVCDSSQANITNISDYDDVLHHSVVDGATIDLSFPIMYGDVSASRVVSVSPMTSLQGVTVDLVKGSLSDLLLVKGVLTNPNYLDPITKTGIYSCLLIDGTTFNFKISFTVTLPSTFEPDFTNVSSQSPDTLVTAPLVFLESFKTISEYGTTAIGNFPRQWDYTSSIGICNLVRRHRSLEVKGSTVPSINYTLFNWRALSPLIGNTVRYSLVFAIPTGYHSSIKLELPKPITLHVGSNDPLYFDGVLTDNACLIWVESEDTKYKKSYLLDTTSLYTVLELEILIQSNVITLYLKEPTGVSTRMCSATMPIAPTMGFTIHTTPRDTSSNLLPLYLHNFSGYAF